MSRFLVYDTGLGLEHAVRLVKDGHQVKYFSPWNNNFPTFLDYAIGLGVDGIQKELYFYNFIDWADCICFFDTGMGDLASFLRHKGYRVFGAGHRGERMENHRLLSRWVQQDMGLPTQKTSRIKGMSNLKKFVSRNQSVVIKHDIFRGDLETLNSEDFKETESLLDSYSSIAGPFKEEMMFLVEEKIDGIEPGFDLFFNGNSWVKPYLYGYEYKGAYIGRISDTLPAPLKPVADKLGSYLSRIDYRSAMSTETMVEKSGKAYVIDYTSRMPFPLSLIYTELYDNYSEMIYRVSGKEDVQAKPRGKYCGILPLVSEYAKTHWVPIGIEAKHRNRVKFFSVASNQGKYYAIRGLSTVANIVYVGNSIDEVVEGIKEGVGLVRAHDLDGMNATGSLEEIKRSIKEGLSMGIPF